MTKRLIEVAYHVAMRAIAAAVERHESPGDSLLISDALVLVGLVGELRLLDALPRVLPNPPAEDLALFQRGLGEEVGDSIEMLLTRIEGATQPSPSAYQH